MSKQQTALGARRRPASQAPSSAEPRSGLTCASGAGGGCWTGPPGASAASSGRPGHPPISGVWGRWPGPLCFLRAQQPRGRRVLVHGETRVLGSPPAFSLLFQLVLPGPLPGQAGQSGPDAPADRPAAGPPRVPSPRSRGRFASLAWVAGRRSAILYWLSSTHLPATLVYERLALCSSSDSLVAEAHHKQVYKQTLLSKMVVSALKKIRQNKVMEQSQGWIMKSCWRVLGAERRATAKALAWEQTELG